MDLTARLFSRGEPLRVQRGYRLISIISLVVASAVVWASWATLDEQVRAPGTVIVSSRSQVIQVVDGGVLRKLHVKEGSTVKAGDLLAELDTVRFAASTDEIGAKVISLRAAIQRADAELEGRALVFSKDVMAYPDIVSSQRDLFERRRQLQAQELSGLEEIGRAHV